MKDGQGARRGGRPGLRFTFLALETTSARPLSSLPRTPEAATGEGPKPEPTLFDAPGLYRPVGTMNPSATWKSKRFKC